MFGSRTNRAAASVPGLAVTRSIGLVADIRTCAQCGVLFVPQREHARFCSASCRLSWNRRHANEPPVETAALDWSVTAMRETTDRLLRAGGQDQANGLALISEAVWWVTMVDATLVRYHPDCYGEILVSRTAAKRRVIEETFGGLRFVRNQMGQESGPAAFILPPDLQPGHALRRVAAWTWQPVPEPPVEPLSPRGQTWEMTRYRAYQAQLAHHPVGETFRLATGFLGLAIEGSRLSTGSA
jgi:hypothetical protein